MLGEHLGEGGEAFECVGADEFREPAHADVVGALCDAWSAWWSTWAMSSTVTVWTGLPFRRAAFWVSYRSSEMPVMRSMMASASVSDAVSMSSAAGT